MKTTKPVSERLTVICNTQKEAQFASQICLQKGYQNITTTRVEHVQVFKVEGEHPNYTFSEICSQLAEEVWLIVGEKGT